MLYRILSFGTNHKLMLRNEDKHFILDGFYSPFVISLKEIVNSLLVLAKRWSYNYQRKRTSRGIFLPYFRT